MEAEDSTSWFDLGRLERAFKALDRQRSRGIITDREFLAGLVRAVHDIDLKVPPAARRSWTAGRVELAIAFATRDLANTEAFEECFGAWQSEPRFQRWFGACDVRLGIGDPAAKAELIDLYGVGRPIVRGEHRYPEWFQQVSAVDLVVAHRVTEVIEWLWPAAVVVETDTHPSCQFGFDTRHLCGEATAVRAWLEERASDGDPYAIDHLRAVAATGHGELAMMSARSLPMPWRARAMEAALRRMSEERVVDLHLHEAMVRRDLPAGAWSRLAVNAGDRGDVVLLSFEDIAPALTDPIARATLESVADESVDLAEDAVFAAHLELFEERVWRALHWGEILGPGLVSTPDPRRRGIWMHVEDGSSTDLLRAAVEVVRFYELGRQAEIELWADRR